MRYRVGATAPAKLAVVDALVDRHRGEPTLVIGQFLDQLESLAQRLGAPLISGKTPNRERERLYDAFRAGEEQLLVVSKNDQDFAANRQRFLAEQGYACEIVDGVDVLGSDGRPGGS